MLLSQHLNSYQFKIFKHYIQSEKIHRNSLNFKFLTTKTPFFNKNL